MTFSVSAMTTSPNSAPTPVGSPPASPVGAFCSDDPAVAR